ncbi:MAG: hypothetical protein ACK5LO_15120 [Leucobacter sp.]
MPRPLRPLPSALGAVFTAAEARRAGVSRSRLLSADVERVFHGVYRRASRDPESVRSQSAAGGEASTAAPHPSEIWRDAQLRNARAALELLRPGQFFSHRTAAVILRLPVPARDDDLLDIACVEPGRAPRRAGVRARQLSAGQAQPGTCQGFPVVSPASAWAMLGGELDLPDIVALGDAAIRHPRIPGTQRLERSPYATVEELEKAIASGRRRGNALLRQALPLLSTSSASPPESHLRLQLREWGFPEPDLDVDVFDHEGNLIGCSELAFCDYRVALEYEGDHHRTRATQWNRDIDKYHAYALAGWLPVRITASLQYRRQPELRERIAGALRSRGWRP